MTNEELAEKLERIAIEHPSPEARAVLLEAADRIEEMGEYCLELGVRYE